MVQRARHTVVAHAASLCRSARARTRRPSAVTRVAIDETARPGAATTTSRCSSISISPRRIRHQGQGIQAPFASFARRPRRARRSTPRRSKISSTSTSSPSFIGEAPPRAPAQRGGDLRQVAHTRQKIVNECVDQVRQRAEAKRRSLLRAHAICALRDSGQLVDRTSNWWVPGRPTHRGICETARAYQSPGSPSMTFTTPTLG